MSTAHYSRTHLHDFGPYRQRRYGAATLLMLFGLFASGCDPISLTAFGVGSAAGIQHTLGGISYRAFTVPLPQVHAATLTALTRMGIKDAVWRKTPEGGTITAKAGDRDIEVVLDAVTPKTTRMRTMVRNGILMDSATGTEIILQTERILGNGKENLS